MRAIILAAGRGMRLQQPAGSAAAQVPVAFRRHDAARAASASAAQRGCRRGRPGARLRRHELVEAELDRLRWQPRPEIVLNERFELGSVLTVHTVAEAMTRGGDVLLMDADVLYRRAHHGGAGGRPETGEPHAHRPRLRSRREPVKVCVRDGRADRVAQAACRRSAVRHHRRVGGFLPLRRARRAAAGRPRGRLCRQRPRQHAARGSGARSAARAQPGRRGGRCHRRAVDRDRFSE